MEKVVVLTKEKRKWKRRSDISSTLYSIPLCFGIVLDVKNTANAWWKDKQILDKLIAAFRIASTIEMACLYAGITVRQYKYFVDLHPEFNEARQGFILEPGMVAKRNIIAAIHKGDIKTMKWYLERTDSAFARPSRRGGRRRYHWPRESEGVQPDPTLLKITRDYEEKIEEMIKGRAIKSAQLPESKQGHHEQKKAGNTDIVKL